VADDPRIPESWAKRILLIAVKQDRAAELLECLFDGGSVTLDQAGGLILLDGKELAKLYLWGDADE
jgi:hypothetical protein